MIRRSGFLWTPLFLMVGAGSLPAADLEYNRDIRPILAANCFQCHGPDSAARKADLRIDRLEDATAGGAVTPGKPDESELVRRIFSDDAEELMPPADSHKQLKPQEKELLKRWVAQGAEYQPHWSLIAPKRPTPPKVTDARWPANPIDNFILAKLEKVGLKPAPEADRRTLARRLSLDLRGLPPAPDEVEKFVNDSAPNAYEAYVDRLLASPHYGEHRGRYWLDAARYADTHGIHFDNYRENWAYREWVINAFNQNMPFDQFTVEQLAGDLLEKPTLDQLIGSGFNRCNITTNEGGIIDEEYLVLYARDRTETTSLVWMGMTAGCAVCHDHKFDPISQREFYEMAAFFNNTTQAAKDGNIKDTPPIVVVPTKEDRPRWVSVNKDVADTQAQLADRRTKAAPEFDKWLGSSTAWEVEGTLPTEGLDLYAYLDEGEGSSIHLVAGGKPRSLRLAKPLGWADGHLTPKAFAGTGGNAISIPSAGDFEKDQPFAVGAWVKFDKSAQTGAIVARMDDPNGHRGWDFLVEGGRVGCHLIHQWPEVAIKTLTVQPLPIDKWQHVFLTYDGSGHAAGVQVYLDGKPQPMRVVRDTLTNTMKTTVPLSIGQRHVGSKLDKVGLQDLRIYSRKLTGFEVEQIAHTTRAVALSSKPKEKLSGPEKNELFDYYLGRLDAPYRTIVDKLKSLEGEKEQIKARGTVAHVMTEKDTPPIAYVLNRGEYDQRRDEVKAKTPEALPPLPSSFPRNRLGFAQWLLQPEHPLTARVTVNRFWQELFGTGLVRTAGDFGIMGELPSHPELLDWLAVEFRESGWNTKRFFKLIVMSSTYRQMAQATPEKIEKDPQNRLVSRGPRYRMDAEMVRDFALASSGILVPKIGGPSVKPYQPEGVWEAVAMIGSNTRDYRHEPGENLYRRSMYTFWKRSAPPASMDIFNAPSRENCTVNRERTNTPLQALVTLNDPQFVEAARHLAEVVLRESKGAEDAALNAMAMRLLSRPLNAEELSVAKHTLADFLKYYREHKEDAGKLLAFGESKRDESLDPTLLAGWTMLANEMMNLDEALNK